MKADSMVGQTRGLMFSQKKWLLMSFKTSKRRGVHMWFVFFPLHIYYLDEALKVVDYAYLKPWQWHNSQKKCRYILESQKALADPKSFIRKQIS